MSTPAVYVDMPPGLYSRAEMRAWFTLAKIDGRLPRVDTDLIIAYPLAKGGQAYRVRRSLNCDGYIVERQG